MIELQAKRIIEGSRIEVRGSRGTVRYIGKLHEREEQWVGVEWDEKSRGKHSGSYHGRQYFNCAPGTGSFLKLDRVGYGGRLSLLEAVKKRYAEDALDTSFRESVVIVGGGLISIEDCDDKRKRAVGLSRIEIVDVSGMGVAFVKEAGLRQTLPKVRELRIARSLFVGTQCLLEVLEAFPQLRALDASDNVLEVLSEYSEGSMIDIDMRRVGQCELEELILNRCSLSWLAVRMICEQSTSLLSLRLHNCNLGRIDEKLGLKGKLNTLQVLDVDRNKLEWDDVMGYLGKLENLKEVYLSNNDLHDVDLPDDDYFMKVETLSLANNALGGWKVITWLERLGALKHLRIRENPVTMAGEGDEQDLPLRWRMRVIGRIGGLKVLDGSTITKDERILSEKRYLSVEVGAKWLKDGKNDLREHPRADELYRLYGMGSRAPGLGGMRDEMLEVRLLAGDGVTAKREFVVRKVPRGARMSRVRAVGKRLLGIEQQCRVGVCTEHGGDGEGVVWETDLSRSLGHWTSRENVSGVSLVIGRQL